MATNDLGIYVPGELGPLFHFHLNSVVGPASMFWSYYSDLQAFINSSHARKIVCGQIPYPYNDNLEKLIDQVYDHTDAIIVLGSELHNRTVEFIRRYDRSKIHWFVCGALTQPLVNSRNYAYLDWFITSVHFYKNVRPSTLYDLRPYDVKPYAFDALLGRNKPHRFQAYNFINTNKLNGITTFVGDNKINFNGDDTTSWIWESDGLTGADNVEWTVNMVTYYGHRMSLSQVIPLSVYNQSAYSLICETNFDNGYVFFTEKTVKPILARRLFITLTHQYALATLRELGFKTFDGIIDESYDKIENPVERHAAALEQLKWLCAQDQQEILAKVKPITDHNFNHMMGHDWRHDYTRQLGRVLLNQ